MDACKEQLLARRCGSAVVHAYMERWHGAYTHRTPIGTQEPLYDAHAVHAPCMPLQKDNTGGKAVAARPMGISAPPSLANLMAGAESAAAAAAAALAPPLLSRGTQASQTPAAGAGGSGAAVLGGSAPRSTQRSGGHAVVPAIATLPEYHDTGGVPLSSPPSPIYWIAQLP
jgi:hypothetical protein